MIVKTLDAFFSRGVGNRITRLLFDTALLLYVDRFCPATYPTQDDINLFEQFVANAFVWAYSLRTQYTNLGWQSAQNYILEQSNKINSLNIYKVINDADSPVSLLSELADRLNPLSKDDIAFRSVKGGNVDDAENETYKNYLHFFKINAFYTE